MRQKIKLEYKNSLIYPYTAENINHAFLVMTNQGFINSEKLEEEIFNKAKQERLVIEKDLLNKMSADAIDIIRVMLIAPREFLFILSQITSINKKCYFMKVNKINKQSVKMRFRVWLIRFLKEKYNCTYLDADIKAGKIILEIKTLVC